MVRAPPHTRPHTWRADFCFRLNRRISFYRHKCGATPVQTSASKPIYTCPITELVCGDLLGSPTTKREYARSGSTDITTFVGGGDDQYRHPLYLSNHLSLVLPTPPPPLKRPESKKKGVWVGFFFFIPFIVFALLSLLLPVVPQIRGHIAGPPPPSPLRYVPSFFMARVIHLHPPSSTRVELYLPTLLGALSS